jgi:hypothetical protein
MTYESCEWCVYRDKRNPDVCLNCSQNAVIVKHRFEFEKVDVFKLAEGLKKKKQEQNSKKSELKQGIETAKTPVELGKCPLCGETSFFYNETKKIHECLNNGCRSKKQSGKPLNNGTISE